MSMGFRADPTNTSAVISVAGTDQVVITNASNVVATTFTGALAGNASTATALSTATGAAPVYGARAWVNFNGKQNVSGVVEIANTNRFIRGSGNVTNVLRNGMGDYTVSFAIAMPDANYCTTVGWSISSPSESYDGSCSIYSPASVLVSSVRIFSSAGASFSGVGEDAEYVAVAIFR